MIFDHTIKNKSHISPTRREICHYIDDIYDHPLKILGSITSLWGPNEFFARTHSNMFGIEMITAGNALFIQENRHYLVEPGEVYLLRKNCDHIYRTGPAEFLHKRCLSIDGPLLEPLLYAAGLHETDHIVPGDPVMICRLFRTIHGLLGERDPKHLPKISELVYRLIIELGRAKKPLYPAAIRLALEYMDKNIAAPLSSDGLARKAGLSQTHFNRLFKQHMKTSPMAYFIKKKMNLACYLLLHTPLSIKEVAAATGYENPLYFSAQFKKQHGVSPKYYVERYVPADPSSSGPCYV